MQIRASLPESVLHRALHGWTYPMSVEGQLLAALIDLTGQANTKRGRQWKPVARPWKNANEERLGWTNLSRDEAIKRLRENAGR